MPNPQNNENYSGTIIGLGSGRRVIVQLDKPYKLGEKEYGRVLVPPTKTEGVSGIPYGTRLLGMRVSIPASVISSASPRQAESTNSLDAEVARSLTQPEDRTIPLDEKSK
jgi:hypothetical protein